MIRFTIFKSGLAGQTRYVARVKPSDNYDRERLIGRMLEIGTPLSPGDVRSVLDLLQVAIGKVCADGATVNLDGFVRFIPSMGGTFDNESDGYQSGRHTLHVRASMSAAFNQSFNSTTPVEKLSPRMRTPQFFGITDSASDTEDQVVTPANIVTLRGEGLRFDLDNPNEYLRFVNGEDPSQFVPITKFTRFVDKETMFLMPDTTFTTGFFEIANGMNTATVRKQTSETVGVAA